MRGPSIREAEVDHLGAGATYSAPGARQGAVTVGGNAQVHARQELRIAHRACPAALELRRRHTQVDHLEQRDVFARDQIAAPTYRGCAFINASAEGPRRETVVTRTCSDSRGWLRELFIALAERHKVPAVYGLRQFPASGGLMSYGPDTVDTVTRAAGYVDRILRGEKPAERSRLR